MSKTKSLNIFDAFVFLGFLEGSAMAYILRGIGIWAIKTGSELMSQEKNEKNDAQQVYQETEKTQF